MVIDTKTKKVQKRTAEQVGAILNQIKWGSVDMNKIALFSYIYKDW